MQMIIFYINLRCFDWCLIWTVLLDWRHVSGTVDRRCRQVWPQVPHFRRLVERATSTRSLQAVGSTSPNPPPMTAKEKHLAAVRRLEEPPRCDCGDRAVINPENTLEFVCSNKHEVSAKCMCWNVELYVSCTNVMLFRCIQWQSVVSRSGCMVLRTNGPKNLQKQNKRRKKVNLQSTTSQVRMWC